MQREQDLPARVDVAVIGGGLAGLACGTALAERGLTVAVLERDPRLGGRATSWRDETTGDPVHIGPHILLTAYPNMLGWMERLGTLDRVVWQDDAFIHLVEGPQCHEVRASEKLPPPLHFLPSMLTDPALSRRDLLSNTRVTWKAMRLTDDDILALDTQNALWFLRSMGVTRRCIERFWSFVGMSILNVPLEVCSAGALMRFFREMISHGDTRIGLPATGLSELFAPAAKDTIERLGGVVRCGFDVEAFTGDGRVDGVRVDGHTIRARYVVSSVPPKALRRLARPEWRDRKPFSDLVFFEPCPYVCTTLWFDRKLTQRRFWARVHDPNDLNCDFYDLSNLPGWPPERSIITSNVIWSHRAADLTDEEIVRATVRELAEFLPDAEHATVRHAVVNRVPMAVHCAYPGSEQRRPTDLEPVPGLILAGDWVRTGIPACMEGAVQSGFMAAERVLAAEGRPATLVRPQEGAQGLARWARSVPLHRRFAA